MQVYRRHECVQQMSDAWTHLRRGADELGDSPGHDDVVALLIDAGEIESAAVDGLFPDRDRLDPRPAGLRRVTLSAARLLISSARGERASVGRLAGDLRREIDRVRLDELPCRITRGVSEGYAYYALHPESYAIAAGRFVDGARPVRVVCLGIRGIGTSLSAVVAAALERRGVQVQSHSVRPHGHPFDRTLVLDEGFSSHLARLPGETFFAVIDEGPGLSGSSFASVASALTALGIGAARIVLFPSWNPDGAALRSERARAVWRQHRRFCAADDWHGPESGHRAIDLSAGAWRAYTYRSRVQWPAAHPQHEVRKTWLPSEGAIVRFAGLGGYGAAKRQRAEALAAAGLGPPPGQLANGYLRLPFVEGVPCDGDEAGRTLVDAIAGHTSALVARFPATRAPGVDELLAMTEANLRMAPENAHLARDIERFRPALEDAPCAAIDGRMLPHEWIDTGDSYIKVDALDHHADHFYPGIQDAGWDLAAATVEFVLSEAAAGRMVEQYVRATGDRDVSQRLPFYRLAYLAFRLGYTTLAQETLGSSEEGRRFRRAAGQYRAALRTHQPW